MADILAELRAAIQAQIWRQASAIRAQRAESITPQSTNAGNPFGSGVIVGEDGSFATGWDSVSGLTIVPFTTGISIVGGTDIVVGS
jgi:hypothetical protein